ncbi:hypothetical protein PUATCC27989T_05559 [Phytobacter ursingii]|jgi:hypothetical protein|uniref:DUF2509 family protein n=2 Tax=Enterobacteriaceae TaxID=543 RepID=A0AAC8TL85_9ENTR|nr:MULTISPECIES: DUF2509 family protein [Enterobacteriaceae]HAT2206085.1 DUF2509 family protein [Kluyvera intermedia]AKL10598.1 hypothetical protein AB182_04330 [Phytobacter ursingii]MCL9674362.1 DUF2509 family protein [Citrobacter sp. MNAZ 1397]MDV2865362.1 DUF2509 family protein [Phytobacter ursingii]VTP17551.1 hypothetical protein PUATCC27989T_05559 [Phytobacter ursingii]
MNRQRGISSLALVLLILILGSLMLNGLSQQLNTHIRRVSTESEHLRQYAQVQSAMMWAQRLTWLREPALQCLRHPSEPWQACLRVLSDQTVLLTVGSGKQRLWRGGRIARNNVVFSAHGWSDFCPHKETELCQIPQNNAD